MWKLIALVFFLSISNGAHSARILGYFPTPSYSHFIVGGVIFKELAARGHDVTVISPYPQKTPLKNYRDIELTGFVEHMEEQTKGLNLFEFSSMNILTKLLFINDMSVKFAEMTFENSKVKDLLNSSEEFDLVIMESFYMDSSFGLCHRFKVPCVLVTTSSSSQDNNRYTGNIALSSYIPGYLTENPPVMNFFQRLSNLFSLIASELFHHLYAVPRHNTVLHKYFPDAPHVYDLSYNTSMVLINSDPRLTAPIPLLPNVKEVGGLHIDENTKLPEDIQTFLDNNKDVIYFAFGSNLDSKDLPADKLKGIFAAFKKWGKPILWKFGGKLPENLDNVKTSKWLPQPAVLAHKNVKVFITHGGRLSTMESLYFGVPMIGIPIFAEQPYNIAQMEYAGYGVRLNFVDLNEETLYNAIVEITSNPRYAKQAKVRSDAMQNKPMKALDEAVYWVEYVLKYEGAQHLRNSGVDLPWYKLWMADVVVFVAFGFVLYVYVMFKVCFRTTGTRKIEGSKKKKIN